jgi:hypothetical protein
MSRVQRIRIVAGLTAGIAGILFAVIGPAASIALIPPMSSPKVGENDLHAVFDHIHAIQSAGDTGGVLFLIGAALSIGGFFFAFYQWSCAFVTSPNNG